MAQKQHAFPYQTKFIESLFKISHRFSLSHVFDDLLTMVITSCTRNPVTGESYYEDEYLSAMSKYKDSDLRFEFPKAFAYLIEAMEERVNCDQGNDVLGEFFEQNISNGRNGQFFTPYHICTFMSALTQETGQQESGEPLRILDPSCGSGRMLLASYRQNGKLHLYYGIDVDLICVKMTAINLFFNGIWKSEVMCANALMPNDFVVSYRISLLPLGIFKITEKEKSSLFHAHQNSFMPKEKLSDKIILDSTLIIERKKDEGTQLGLF